MDIDYEDVARSDAELKAELEARANGEKVVLLVKGNEYGEVIRKTEIAVTVAFFNRYTEMLTEVLEKEGYKPVLALRILKANGTRVYMVKTDHGNDIYTCGKYIPAPKPRKAA